MGKKKNTKKISNDDDDDNESVMSARSIENLKSKEKKELLNFLNEQLNKPLVFYSSYYRKHGQNILQRNYHKKNQRNKDGGDGDGDDDGDGDGEFNQKTHENFFDSERGGGNVVSNNTNTNTNNNINTISSIDKKAEFNGNDGGGMGGMGGGGGSSDAGNSKPIYRKRCDEETCYFDLKEKAHAFPMKWFESQKTYNDYLPIPRTTKEIEINGDNDRNTNFALFNRQLLKKGKWEKMDRNMQAKYYIYENPLPEIQNFVMDTVRRNQQYERTLREKIKQLYGKDPSPADLQQLVEKQRRESLEASQKANQRLKEQFSYQLNTRNSDLQYLLEGQQTALDAIRLKEYLILKPMPVRHDLHITNKDRRRLGNLLSNR